MHSENIIIRGARHHNLKNIDIDIPRNKLVVITGLSGSGKSTLAFDTLYAEGRRRYVESLSAYARQFLERMEKPDVDLIEGLSPAIAIEQKTAGHNPRSTLGTITEIYDYLRLLYARTGIPHCPICGRPIASQSIDQMVDQVMALAEKTKIMILSPVVTGEKGTHAQLFKRLKKEGFARVRIDGDILDIETVGALPPRRAHHIDVVLDRLVIRDRIRNRLADSMELALKLSDGVVEIHVVDGEPLRFSEKPGCTTCGTRFAPLTPAAFSFNSPQGACPHCDGLGSITEFDPHRIVPNPELSLREGAVLPWAERGSVQFFEFMDSLTAHYHVDIYTPYKELPDHFKQALLYGSGDEPILFYSEQNQRRITYEKPFEGLIPKLRRQFEEADTPKSREEIRRYMSCRPCPKCGGTRLNEIARHVTVGGLTISQVTALTIENACLFFESLVLSGKNREIARRILKEISERLGFLRHVGLTYLTLDRSADTLSGGESQRIRLATQIGSKLTGVLYVLDEPSIGLHQRDNQRLLETLTAMRDLGNTVVVVEHDAETILTSDFVVDMGPGAGVHGGDVVFSGPPDRLIKDDTSLTGRYLSGRKCIPVPNTRRTGSGKKIIIEGASENNLKQISAAFPLGCLICVTGVSGSGKSTLVLETLYPVLAQHLNRARISSGAHTGITGIEHVDKVIHIDQSPIGKTPRSNPGTYTGVFTHIRDLFSKTPEARLRGYRPGRFSFNIKGGRCEACGGDGIIKIEMHFLPDVFVTCDVCNGKRYNRETLEIRYKGYNIDEVLNMTVNQGLSLFGNVPAIRTKLDTLVDVGLGYVRLGQPGTTLSGGEAQRVKLARELSKKATGNTLYILDEPTTGLHFDDISRLLSVLNQLVDRGNTVIIIEHNLDIVKSADYLIDLGPEGGDAGGTVVGAGTPEELTRNPASYTGQFLKTVL